MQSRVENTGTGQLELVTGCFGGLGMLEELDLGRCGLAALPAVVFMGLHSLRRLAVSGNWGLELASGCFSGPSMLTDLHPVVAT